MTRSNPGVDAAPGPSRKHSRGGRPVGSDLGDAAPRVERRASLQERGRDLRGRSRKFLPAESFSSETSATTRRVFFFLLETLTPLSSRAGGYGSDGDEPETVPVARRGGRPRGPTLPPHDFDWNGQWTHTNPAEPVAEEAEASQSATIKLFGCLHCTHGQCMHAGQSTAGSGWASYVSCDEQPAAGCRPAAAMSSVETGWMSSAETGQVSAVEIGVMSAAETGQMSASETRQMYTCRNSRHLVSAADICSVSPADISISSDHSASAFRINNQHVMEAATAADLTQASEIAV